MSRSIHIGLVNNMPDGALEATERQFRRLLGDAADGNTVRLSLFEIGDVPRSEQVRDRMPNSYASVDRLWESDLDGLIVTGAEPRVPKLTDEPYWTRLAQVIDWAEDNTASCIYSCLAAHAAVLRRDGIGRVPLAQKLFGVYECAPVLDHPMTAGLPGRVWMPHSRWNDLPEKALVECGYRTLTRSSEAGVDAFVKHGKSLSVFFQGHPEYEAPSLALEYRRDVRRFLSGETATHPFAPQGYFGEDGASMRNTWHPAAVRFYRNWVRYLAAQQRPAAYKALTCLSAKAAVAAKEGRDGPF